MCSEGEAEEPLFGGGLVKPFVSKRWKNGTKVLRTADASCQSTPIVGANIEERAVYGPNMQLIQSIIITMLCLFQRV